MLWLTFLSDICHLYAGGQRLPDMPALHYNTAYEAAIMYQHLSLWDALSFTGEVGSACTVTLFTAYTKEQSHCLAVLCSHLSHPSQWTWKISLWMTGAAKPMDTPSMRPSSLVEEAWGLETTSVIVLWWVLTISREIQHNTWASWQESQHILYIMGKVVEGQFIRSVHCDLCS